MSTTPMSTTSLKSAVVERQSCKQKVLGSILRGGWAQCSAYGKTEVRRIHRTLCRGRPLMAARRWVACTALGWEVCTAFPHLAFSSLSFLCHACCELRYHHTMYPMAVDCVLPYWRYVCASASCGWQIIGGRLRLPR